MRGKVKWFVDSRGRGFIGRDNGPYVLVHNTDIAGEGYRTLRSGDRVEFEIVQGPSGRPHAANVVVTHDRPIRARQKHG